MNDIQDAVLLEILRQEHLYQFEVFSNSVALELGLKIISLAEKEGKAVMIEININGQQIFHHAMTGTGPENSQWISKKNNVTNRFKHSSLYMWRYYNLLGEENEKQDGIDTNNYALVGGAFPVHLKEVGMIGTITVSGLPHEQDHVLITRVLESYFLNKC